MQQTGAMRVLSILCTLSGMGIRRRPGRTVYLALTTAVTVTAWLGLSAMASPFLEVANVAATHNTLTVKNARISSHVLPHRYARRLAGVPGISGFQYLTNQIVQCRSGQTITLSALGGVGLAEELRNAGFSAAAVGRWQSDRLGVLVGSQAAGDCGWTDGMGIRPPTVIKHTPLELHVSGVAPPGSAANGTVAYVHYEYVNKVAPLFGVDTVLWFTVTPTNPRHMEELAQRIEQAFAHSDPPVAAYPESAFKNSWARFGKVQNLIALVMVGLFVCCALVLVSVLAHTAAERRRHVAVLQVLGYPRWLQLAGFALEHAGIVCLGVVVGIAGGYYAPAAISGLFHGLFRSVTIPSWAYVVLPIWVAGLWLLALAIPTAIVWRVRPTDCRDA